MIPVRARALIATVAGSFCLDARAVLSDRRLSRIVAARQVCISLLLNGCDRNGKPRSLPLVGRLLGRDHTTVLHSDRRYRQVVQRAGLPVVPDDIEVHADRIALHLGFISSDRWSEREAERARKAEALEAEPEPAPEEPTTEISEPAVSGPDAPEPETYPMLAVIPATVPPRLSNGADFGCFDVAGWHDLPVAMRREGVLLFLERDEAEHPRRKEHVRFERCAAAFNLSVHDLRDLLRARELHDLPQERTGRPKAHGADAACDDAPMVEGRVLVEADGSTARDGFETFAWGRLTKDPSGATSVATAYSAYVSFAKGAGFDLLPRSQFGFELRRYAGGLDRHGDMQLGVTFESGR